MIRAVHRWPGLVALALVVLLALSGAALSLFSAAERLSVPQADAATSVAELATRIRYAYPGVEQIKRSPSGRITAYWFDNGTPGSALIEPATGKGVASADPNQVERWLINLHRSLFLDDVGRLVSAAGAGAMLVLSISGTFMVARRVGGWRRWLSPVRGPLLGRIHVELARGAVLGLLVSSLTALWMTASTFELLPDQPAVHELPLTASGKTALPLAGMPLLSSTSIANLRELTFPYPDDKADVFTLKTSLGTAYIDQGTGATLGWFALTNWQRATETVYMLHTGQGAALLGLLLGAMALAVPAMAATGFSIWLFGRSVHPRIKGNVAPSRAETIILVGSEGGSTWGFAANLHAALTNAGQRAHVAPMSSFDPARTSAAQHYLVLAATYGDGDAPASAKGFVEKLNTHPGVPFASLGVLGFGDRSFPRFCAYAQTVEASARANGWSMLLPLDTVDRQSPQDFARWGRALGEALGIVLELEYRPLRPTTVPLTLMSRRDYGLEVQAPTAILRFALPRISPWQRLFGQGFSRFEAGDLIGIVPEGSNVPRFYSLASDASDGFVEIVVRKHAGGLCSGALLALESGDAVAAFLRRNPNFHAGASQNPLILIGAGTGIGPLAGFIRANAARRPIHLFFGMRHPQSDFLYREELEAWVAEGRLADLSTAASRGPRPRYIQHALAAEHAAITCAVRDGARVMVCGGREMAFGVAEAMAVILKPLGLSPAKLRAQGRYVEDVY